MSTKSTTEEVSRCCGKEKVPCTNGKTGKFVEWVCQQCGDTFTPSQEEKKERFYSKSMWELEMEEKKEIKHENLFRHRNKLCQHFLHNNHITPCPDCPLPTPKEGWEETIQKDLDNGKFGSICSNETTFKKYIFPIISSIEKEYQDKLLGRDTTIEGQLIMINALKDSLQSARLTLLETIREEVEKLMLESFSTNKLISAYKVLDIINKMAKQ